MKRSFFAGLLLWLCVAAPLSAAPVKLGFFFGGRTYAFYRAYVMGYFEREGVELELESQFLKQDGWRAVPRSHGEARALMHPGWLGRLMSRGMWGRVTGKRILDAADSGRFEGGTPGEFSFIERVSAGVPLVAVATLGVEEGASPGKAIVLRKGLEVRSPSELKGKTFITRRAGDGDGILLREFLAAAGLREDEVRIIDQVPDDAQESMLAQGKADAALFHLLGIIQADERGEISIHRKMDWVRPGLSHALLVFRRDFVERHPDTVTRIVRAYMKRIKYEKGLPLEEKLRPADAELRILTRYKGMSTPVPAYPPYVRLDALREAQRLLLKYKRIDEKVDLKDFIDDRFVKKALEDIH